MSVETVLSYLSIEDESLVIDALFTLREHPDRIKARNPLLELLRVSSGNIREQTIVTLGYLGTNAAIAIDELLSILTDQKETVWAKAYALFALGKIGEKRAAPEMINYLVDHRNPYRDSASWGLQGIAKQNLNDKLFIDELKQVYLQALLAETDDAPGRYAKGNIVYSLGELDATEMSAEIIHWLQQEEHPYVLEDGIQAVGRIADTSALPLILQHLHNIDPVVRCMAIEALVRISSKYAVGLDIQKYTAPMLTDKVIVVKEYAKHALGTN